MSETLVWLLGSWLGLNYALASLLTHRALRRARTSRGAALAGALAWPARLFAPTRSGA